VELDEQADQQTGQTAIKFHVNDTGVGIAADVLPTLFEPFTQADSYLTREHEGTGLGLAISRRLVELMGGRIWAESTPGKGSAFSFTVVMETRIELPERVDPHPAQEPVKLPIQRLTGHRVLVVEDSELNRDVAVALLEEVGLIVEVAENGRIAVDKVTGTSKGYYDGVLMDIQMPVMDGYEATRCIREWERQQPVEDPVHIDGETINQKSENRIPVIALTAHALKGEKEKCLGSDMDDYLAKPLDEKDLHRMLLKWIAPKQVE
jgi:CheY-like chemotaxis protein